MDLLNNNLRYQSDYEDAEIVAIIAFITNSWGGEVLVVSEQDVQAARAAMSPAEEAGRAP